MPFDTRGALWFDAVHKSNFAAKYSRMICSHRSDGVAQTHTALFIALVVQLVVLWFNFTNKGFWPVIGGIPSLLMWKRYRDRCRRRHATRNLHGLARGRMPLRDGNVVDALRDGDVVRDALAHLADRDRFFEAPEVLPPKDHPVYRDALPGPPITSSTDVEARLEAVNAWLERYDDAAAAFLERVNGTATVLGEDAILVSDDIACGTMGCGGL